MIWPEPISYGGQHWLIIHDWNEEEGCPDWWEIEHEHCLQKTSVYDSYIPTEDTIERGWWRQDECEKVFVFETHYEVAEGEILADRGYGDHPCPVEREISDNYIWAFGQELIWDPDCTSWRVRVDMVGRGELTTEKGTFYRCTWPKELPTLPGRYEIEAWYEYYPGEYGGAGECDSGLRLVNECAKSVVRKSRQGDVV